MMQIDEYQYLIRRTMFSNKIVHDKPKYFDEKHVIYYALGLAGESGEVIDEIKKVYFHNHKYDSKKIKNEMGDVLWYLFALANELGFNVEEIAIDNLNKLKERYPNGFTTEDSIERNDMK